MAVDPKPGKVRGNRVVTRGSFPKRPWGDGNSLLASQIRHHFLGCL